MDRRIFNLIFALMFLYTFTSKAADMQSYCYVPPFMGQAISPNVMLVIDVSGSMSWCAYNPTSGKYGCCNNSNGCGWTYKGTEEGYFDPNKVYKYNNSNGYWEESSGTPSTCPKRQSGISTGKLYKGSCLNFLYMSRIDLVRWALTGGTLSSCNTGINTGNYQIKRCNPESYGTSGDQTSCDSYGCILKTYTDTKVKVPWDRINQALLFQLKNLSLEPRIGVMFFSGNRIRNNASVYIGDFTSSNNYDALNPYKNAITHINVEDPSGATPTAPALWDTYNYFAQENPGYGGLNPQSGSGDKWKNPMYQCFNENNNDQCEGSELKLVPCAKNFVILLTDGQWNYGGPPGSVAWKCTIDYGFESSSADPVVPAYWLHKRGFTNQKTGISSRVEALYGIGLFLGGTGETSLKNVSMYGSFDINGRNWPDSLTGYPQNTCNMDDCGSGKGSGCTPLPSSSPDWDKDGNGQPDTFYSASDATEIKNAILNAILDILKRASSGSTVATLSTKTSISSLMIQPFFFSSYTDSTGRDINWIGFSRSYWVDPKNDNREDTNSNKVLNLDVDKIFQIYFDYNYNQTKAAILTDTSTCTSTGTKDLVNLIPVFDSSCWLGNCNPSDRRIYYNAGNSLKELTTSNSSDFKNIWDLVDNNSSDNSINDSTTQCIIRFLRGEDLSSDSTCLSNDYVKRNMKIKISDVCPGLTGDKIWKLGDTITSTPAVVSNEKLNNYDYRYQDSTYYSYVNSEDYKNRPSILIQGANDGMLHFFRMGTITDQSTTDPDNPVKLQNSPTDSGNNLIGKEEFAFIPKNAIPYLLWYGRKDYCHVPTLDSRVIVFDASINGNPNDDKTSNSWRTIVIGTMGFGGKALTAGNTTYSSSLFALDITDWLKNPSASTPTVLWEITLPDNTLVLSYPSVIRLGDATKNGNWYVVVGTGPNDPKPDSNSKFVNNPKIYFFDLKTGNKVNEITIPLPNNTVTAVGDTFPVDVDNDYSDDTIYFGLYGLKKQGNVWNNWGQFYRLVIKNGLSSASLSNAVDMETFTNNNHTPPVTAAPNFTKDEKGNLWVFFGTGRYLTEDDKTLSYKNYFIGFKDPCWNGSCSTTFTKSDFTDTTNENIQATVVEVKKVCICDSTGCSNKDVVYTAKGNTPAEVDKGWYKELSNEGVISQSLVFGSIIDFMTFIPPNDICAYEGNSKLYALYYKSGTAYPNPAILSPNAVTGTISVGQTVTINPSVNLGVGIPPRGNPFQVSVSQNSPNTYEKFIQISSGVVVRQSQQPITGKPGFILWIEK
ncbi:pilus assembly protein [Sulfurihydrogenibium subterraneum]|uniref:pilus assembly protein n=1 Tax=Sulfurihydrogenibium subterraneum TaxID=171121 RepID=UPI00056D3881|nr:PilC/PilY family type IV pilus protein [Sulfurihydrogenibium subterraneum]